ncbi:hypothetical protein QTJ16_001296 [Diplocarpon rosae]|uniref:Uncharacterized protein n=1 Tax=Diplocarpon rosae TaxID=946125 RepID=A0AAD9T777_9HELO|nr:hypothetical protein QTJ16_001296 [Diplocarpon rosae]PBP28950.1 hypothetical protein BUE80_DR000172 [Diplocarpon rosae]
MAAKSNSTHQPAFSDPFATGTLKNSYTPLPIHTSALPAHPHSPTTPKTASSFSSDQTSAQSERLNSATSSSCTDGRRNSSGENLTSPTENWKPSLGRVQSWNREDYKRGAYISQGEMRVEEGQAKGFTEVGEETGKV